MKIGEMDSSVSAKYTDDAIKKIIRDGSPGKRQAENVFFVRYQYLIREAMKKYGLSEEDSFSAYADAILQTLQNIETGTFQSRSSLKTYLYKVFFNKCVDLIRKTTTKKSSVHHTSPALKMMAMLSDRAKNVMQLLIEKQDHVLLKRSVARLNEKCRQLLMLFAEGFSDKEIMEQTDYKTPDVVKTSRMRCLEKLRELYKNEQRSE